MGDDDPVASLEAIGRVPCLSLLQRDDICDLNAELEAQGVSGLRDVPNAWEAFLSFEHITARLRWLLAAEHSSACARAFLGSRRPARVELGAIRAATTMPIDDPANPLSSSFRAVPASWAPIIALQRPCFLCRASATTAFARRDAAGGWELEEGGGGGARIVESWLHVCVPCCPTAVAVSTGDGAAFELSGPSPCTLACLGCVSHRNPFRFTLRSPPSAAAAASGAVAHGVDDGVVAEISNTAPPGLCNPPLCGRPGDRYDVEFGEGTTARERALALAVALFIDMRWLERSPSRYPVQESAPINV